MNTTSCSVPPRQPKMFSSTPSSRTSVTAWPISSRNSRWMVSTAYSPNSTWPPSGRWNNDSPGIRLGHQQRPVPGRLMTAIALMICRFELTRPVVSHRSRRTAPKYSQHSADGSALTPSVRLTPKMMTATPQRDRLQGPQRGRGHPDAAEADRGPDAARVWPSCQARRPESPPRRRPAPPSTRPSRSWCPAPTGEVDYYWSHLSEGRGGDASRQAERASRSRWQIQSTRSGEIDRDRGS